MQCDDLKFKHLERFHPSLPRYMAMVGVKQHKAHTPQRKKWVLMCKVYILLPSKSKFCHQIKFHHQINGGDQSTINQTIEIHRLATTKNISLPITWWQNVFDHHSCGNGMFLVTIHVVMECFYHHSCGNKKLSVVASLVTKNVSLPTMWWLNFFQSLHDWWPKKLVVTRFLTKKISLQGLGQIFLQQPKLFNCCRVYSDQNGFNFNRP